MATRTEPSTAINPQSAIRNPHSTDGVVVINKPAGITSHDVVNRVRRIYGTRRVGHAGTLDPLATGVLVICLGLATRIVEYLTAGRKEYVAGVVFGVTTDTEDATGHIVSETDASGLTEEAVPAALPQFTGKIRQTPPMVSAVHHEGRRLYELAREGIEVERQPRDVEIVALEMRDFTPGPRATATLRIECSSGTYIRTLAADIGAALGAGGMMRALERTRVGAFTLSDARSLEELEAHKTAGTLPRTLRSIADSLSDWPRFALTAEEIARITHGQSIRRGPSAERGPDDLVLLTDTRGEAIAIARIKGDTLAPVKVLITAGD